MPKRLFHNDSMTEATSVSKESYNRWIEDTVNTVARDTPSWRRHQTFIKICNNNFSMIKPLQKGRPRLYIKHEICIKKFTKNLRFPRTTINHIFLWQTFHDKLSLKRFSFINCLSNIGTNFKQETLSKPMKLTKSIGILSNLNGSFRTHINFGYIIYFVTK